MKPQANIVACLAVILGAAAPGHAGTLHDIDVILAVGPDGITTNRVSASLIEPERVFDADMINFFGNIATEDPGFNAELGAFPPFTVMSFDIADELKVWDGSAFIPAAAPAALEVEFNNQVAFSAGPGELVPGPLMNATSFGDLHNHPDHFLLVDQVPGIYLGTFRFSSASVGDSDVFYFVYRWEPTSGDQVAAEATQQLAIQWVRDTLLGSPCPTDFDADGVTGSSDLASLLAGWGTPATDLDGDGSTGSSDLAVLLAAWGACE